MNGEDAMLRKCNPKNMYNSEPIQPNGWNVYSVNPADIPARYRNATMASMQEEEDLLPVGLARGLLGKISEDEAERLAFFNH